MTTGTVNKKVDFGVFLPVANGGWIISETTPKLDASYEQNKAAAVLADELGYDFIMAMAKWRGYGGNTDHWGTSLESMTMMAGIAEATKRAQVIATVHTILYHPAAAAKMFATLDQISGGRAGMNVVSGSYAGEFQQMGAWPEQLDHDARYDLAREWTQVVKKLWSEERVNHKGEFFELTDCVSNPKPLQKPRPTIICAGTSDKGLGFTIDEADACFVGGRDLTDLARVSNRAKSIAAERGKSIKTYTMVTIIPDQADMSAEQRMKLYQEGADIGAIHGLMRSYGLEPDGTENSMVARAKNVFQNEILSGSADQIAARVKEIIETANLDGMMLTFPDYMDDLRFFGEQVMPRFQGVSTTTGSNE